MAGFPVLYADMLVMCAEYLARPVGLNAPAGVPGCREPAGAEQPLSYGHGRLREQPCWCVLSHHPRRAMHGRLLLQPVRIRVPLHVQSDSVRDSVPVLLWQKNNWINCVANTVLCLQERYRPHCRPT